MNVNGYKWIFPAKRLAIYARDDYRCLWCNRKVKPKAEFRLRGASLDHFLPRTKGGTNCAANLFTACIWCNSLRQDQAAILFAKEPKVLDRIIAQLAKPIDYKEVPNACKRKKKRKRSGAPSRRANSVLVANATTRSPGYA